MAVHEISRRLIGGVWRTVDVEEDGGGNGGSQTPPVTFTGTDPAEAVLTLEADDAQTGHIFRAYNDDGDLGVDIDAGGALDALRIVVQNPPDTGTDPGHIALNPGHFRVIPDGTNPPMEITATDGNNAVTFRVKSVGHGAVVEIDPAVATDAALEIIGAIAQTAANIDIWDSDFAVRRFAVLANGAVLTSQNAAPADGDLNAGEVAVWFDAANGAAKVMAKGKTLDGTVVAGELGSLT